MAAHSVLFLRFSDLIQNTKLQILKSKMSNLKLQVFPKTNTVGSHKNLFQAWLSTPYHNKLALLKESHYLARAGYSLEPDLGKVVVRTLSAVCPGLPLSVYVLPAYSLS